MDFTLVSVHPVFSSEPDVCVVHGQGASIQRRGNSRHLTQKNPSLKETNPLNQASAPPYLTLPQGTSPLSTYGRECTALLNPIPIFCPCRVRKKVLGGRLGLHAWTSSHVANPTLRPSKSKKSHRPTTLRRTRHYNRLVEFMIQLGN